MHTTDPEIRWRAKRMRRNPTLSEQRIWSWLRCRRFGNHKFRRQHPIGGYILDFYCHELRLAIEVDGNQHARVDVAEVDDARSWFLRSLGIDVLRITNRQLAMDSVTVEQQIQWAIEIAEKGTSTNLHAPHPL